MRWMMMWRAISATALAGGCRYHAGAPEFRDGSKKWGCCGAASHDFGTFMELPGCEVGRHTQRKPPKAAVAPGPPVPPPPPIPLSVEARAAPAAAGGVFRPSTRPTLTRTNSFSASKERAITLKVSRDPISVE